MGSDAAFPDRDSSITDFNPRSRMGSDNRRMIDIPPSQISIHALAWGATEILSLVLSLMNFNPRSRMGSDETRANTTKHGLYFNPRSRMGSDESSSANPNLIYIFQSTLSHGERRVMTR